MSPAVRTRCSSAQLAPACTPSGGAAPHPPPLALCLLNCRAHSPVLRRMSSSRPRTDRSVRSAVASNKGSLFSSLLVIVGVKIDTLCRSPPHPRSVAPPPPTPAGATVLAPRAGTTYLPLHHSSPLLLHRLRRPPHAGCTPAPVTPALRSVAPLFLPLMPPPERPPTPTRRAPTPPTCCPTTAPRSSCTSCSDHSPLTCRRCAA